MARHARSCFSSWLWAAFAPACGARTPPWWHTVPPAAFARSLPRICHWRGAAYGRGNLPLPPCSRPRYLDLPPDFFALTTVFVKLAGQAIEDPVLVRALFVPFVTTVLQTLMQGAYLAGAIRSRCIKQ